MDIITSKLVGALLLPPGGPLLLALIGLILWKLRLGRRLLLLGLLLLWLFSLPLTARLLMAGLERTPALSETRLEQSDAEAIVVLGAGRYLKAPEYGEDSVSRNALFRLRYAAWLARRTGLPVIPSGGIGLIAGESEARINARVLREEFGVRVDRIEQRSRNTWENARYTAQLMKKLGIERILLVTDAGHMPRALYAFERNGIQPVPAPTGFVNSPDRGYSWLEALPSSDALANSAYALHEYLGLLRYSFR